MEQADTETAATSESEVKTESTEMPAVETPPPAADTPAIDASADGEKPVEGEVNSEAVETPEMAPEVTSAASHDSTETEVKQVLTEVNKMLF